MNRKIEIKNETSLIFIDSEGDPKTIIEKPSPTKIVKKVKKKWKIKKFGFRSKKKYRKY